AAEDKKTELNERFINFLVRNEKDKLYYFVLASQNPQEVLIVKSPSNNSEMKSFLGYEWSSAKGNEGIKYLGSATVEDLPEDDKDDALENIETLESDDKRVLTNLLNFQQINTPLYDPINNKNKEKINYWISQNFESKGINIPEDMHTFLTKSPLIDMLDFDRVAFSKQMTLTPKHKIVIVSKFDIHRLGDLVDVKIGGTPSRANDTFFKGNNLWVSISEMNGEVISDTKEKITDQAIQNSNVKLIPKGTTLLSFKLSIGKTAIAGKDLYTNEAIAGLIPKSNRILDQYIFQIFNAKLIDLDKTGLNTFGKSLNSGHLKSDVKIPLPPLSIQKKIIEECQSIDNEALRTNEAIRNEIFLIETAISDFINQGYPTKKLENIVQMNPSKREIADLDPNTIVSFVEMASLSEDGFIAEKVEKKLKEVKKGSYKYFAEEDIIIAKITPCMENGKCAIAKGLTNAIGFGSSEYHVFRVDESKILNQYLFAFLNRESIRRDAERNMTGSSGHRRVPDTFYKDLDIAIPPLEIQKKLVLEIEKHKSKIQEAKQILSTIAIRKEQVIKKYLS
ncbi:MAG TPA: type I restriction endonuclease subunit M, partial [Xanthomarina gelatinilytica]|nr:type I restriction endonuclease subunit M [Xanthomarina gelatinilytica]